MIPIKGSAPSPNRSWVTLGLIGITSLIFLFEASLPPESLDSLVRHWGLVPERFWYGLTESPGRLDLWLVPLLTSIFLHGGWAHLIGNMLFLWVFGDGIENRLGPARFLAFYLVVGVAAGITHAALGPGIARPTVGASGAIAGILGAYLLLYPRSWIVLVVPIFFWPFFFRIPTFLFLGFWFFQQLFFGAASSLAPITDQPGGVAWWAHAGGFVFGLLLIHVFKIGTSEPSPKERPKLFPDRDVEPRS